MNYEYAESEAQETEFEHIRRQLSEEYTRTSRGDDAAVKLAENFAALVKIIARNFYDEAEIGRLCKEELSEAISETVATELP